MRKVKLDRGMIVRSFFQYVNDHQPDDLEVIEELYDSSPVRFEVELNLYIKYQIEEGCMMYIDGELYKLGGY